MGSFCGVWVGSNRMGIEISEGFFLGETECERSSNVEGKVWMKMEASFH